MQEEKIRNLSQVRDTHILERLRQLSEEEYIERILVLPDLHCKDRLYVPSSIAIKTQKVFVPQFTSVAINCGMTLIDTGIRRTDAKLCALQDVFSIMNQHAVENKLQRKHYSITREELIDTCRYGARFVVKKYAMSPDILKGMENNGYYDINANEDEIKNNIPWVLLKTGIAQNEIGLNFGGNHFLEFQTIDDIFDTGLANTLRLNPDNLYCLVHTGPGPMAANLVRFYMHDNKLCTLYRMLFHMGKLLYHMSRTDTSRDVVFKKGINPVSPDSEIGSRLMQVYGMCMNYGYAYRLTTFQILKEALGKHFKKELDVRLIWDIAHNSIQSTDKDGEKVFFHRHNCCSVIPGKPVIISGYNNINSLIATGLETDDTLASYDHGFGNIIKNYRDPAEIPDSRGTTYCSKYKRGSSIHMIHSDTVPHYDSSIMTQTASIYERNKIFKLTASLKPMANFKN